jgi:hypothetical protein
MWQNVITNTTLSSLNVSTTINCTTGSLLYLAKLASAAAAAANACCCCCCHLYCYFLAADQFSSGEVALMDQLLGEDWQSFGSKPVSAAALRRLAALDEDQQMMLSNILSKTESLNM